MTRKKTTEIRRKKDEISDKKAIVSSESKHKPRTPADRGTNVRDRPAHIRIPPSPRPSSRPDPESNVPVEPSLARHHKPCTTAPREQEGNSSRPRGTTHVPRPTHPPTGRHRPVTGQVSSAKTYPSVRPRRPNTKTIGHDRPDRTDGRLRPDDGRPSRPTVRTVRSTRSPFHTFSQPGLT
ncbi:unnamed protein product [Microthlaspi erraticum]|uniref:Uncharacterized protein n=1 Tax=Microthlaspi erraticum TaxID=1685480 RepID=A0A6D2I8U5_9BRAS|nr:unnamed protein product [Microthlaspi erraticum]